jgi:hypothetical protein
MSRKSIRLENMMKANKMLLGESVEEDVVDEGIIDAISDDDDDDIGGDYVDDGKPRKRIKLKPFPASVLDDDDEDY